MSEFSSPLDVVEYSIKLINHTFDLRSKEAPEPIWLEMRRVFPYYIGGGYLINRDYKPCGVHGTIRHFDGTMHHANIVDYSHHSEMSLKGIDIKKYANEQGYLFDDGCAPWYLENKKENLRRYFFKLHAISITLHEALHEKKF